MNGIIIIDKPQDFTSFDVVAVMRRILNMKKIGHMGTLDPMATGVLPLLLGKATRIQEFIQDSGKEYIAGFKLGIRTDTLDIWGNILEEKQVSVSQSALEAAVARYKGDILQTPPMYSAVQIGGRRLYDLARQGIEIERPSRAVTIHELELISYDERSSEGRLRVKCSKGTYIRSLIDDIGSHIGCGAVLTELRRTQACGFCEKDAVTLSDAEILSKSGEIAGRILPTESVFTSLRQVSVSDAQAVRFKNGGSLDAVRTTVSCSSDGERLRIKDRQGNFLGLAVFAAADNELKILKLF